MKKQDLINKNDENPIDEEKRDFLYLTTTGLAVAGGAVTAVALINTMNPAKDVLALSTTEVDLSLLEEGQNLTVMWRGKPVFIRHRTLMDISEAQNIDVKELKHKATDQSPTNWPINRLTN